MNFQAIGTVLRIEHILILNDFFWPVVARQPTSDVCRWINEQYDRGTWIGLVRESDLDAETDLLCDIGIYGSRATGTLELDSQCRTTRFTFDFSPDGIRLAEDRWKRLALYAVSYANVLSHTEQRAADRTSASITCQVISFPRWRVSLASCMSA